MIKLLHSADWHLDSPLNGHREEAALHKALLQIPDRIADVCRRESCDILLLAGDLFDGKPSAESIHAVKLALQEVGIPVFISPGNHDFCSPDSLWLQESWPENVHIFTGAGMESVSLPELDCRIYGAAFQDSSSGALLKGFHAEGPERYHIALVHGDPTGAKETPYNPISPAQIAASGLTYLALGHIHGANILQEKGVPYGWPGCPMGRGFDETGEKGVLLVTVEDTAQPRFLPLDTPRFYDWEAEILTDPASAIAELLPATGNDHHYRITLTGEAESVDLAALAARFSQFPHLQLRDHTVPVTDLWSAMGEDSLEGLFFKMLHDRLANGNEAEQSQILLAARIARKLLDGRKVKLP